MAALLREFPQMKLTFNLVPSLLVQLEAFAEERARDWHLELGMKPAHELSDHERDGRARRILPRAARADDRSISALRRAAAEARVRRGIHEPGFSRPAGVAQARVGRSVLSGRRRARAPARAEAARLQRSRQSRAAPGRARDPSPGHSRVSRRRRARAGRTVDLAVLSPDSAAVVRHRHLPQDAPGLWRAAPGVPASGRCGGAAPARAGSVISGCLDATRPACGRPKGRFRTRRPSSPRGPAFGGWRPTKRFSAGPSAASSAATRRGGSSIPGRCTGPTPCRPGARTRSRACSAITRSRI